MKRIVIDSMIIDRIMETPGLLDSIRTAVDRGALVILATHILRDQLDATSDAGHRERLLATYEALPKEDVPTHGTVIGTSKVGQARLGNGAESGVSLGQVKTGGRGGWHDALIATTASGDADVLVTCETDLPKKVRAAGAKCEVWNFQDFVAYVRATNAR